MFYSLTRLFETWLSCQELLGELKALRECELVDQPDNTITGKAWQAFVGKYRRGDVVTGEVIRLAKRNDEVYGVLSP